MKKIAIAIDGPAGSGKSTIAKTIAKELSIIYVDTGAMYRAVAYDCLAKEVSLGDEEAVVAVLEQMDLQIKLVDGEQRIYLYGVDVTKDIRTQKVGQGASDVAKIQKVRQTLGDMQRDMAKEHSLVMDGRDIGTCILPEAEVKIYLDAKAEKRAERRVGELIQKGETPNLDVVLQEVILRDTEDMNRKHNPLRQAEDAIYVDTTDMNIEEAVAAILQITKDKVGGM
ncbi:(d)CMP kinase [Chakrabartyella piscis]|uniref:(d)CMP kinase n=1 Tax=Chakrabartyella piscis TaxID=2918914 RepID=UPI0029583C68|nr:(d)CMP kinase [Chakrabartyella piscis]